MTGRARLGGIPMGFIAVETRTVENRIPADPGNQKSEEMILQEAGQVWYPNSAYKTAQAINDFNFGEQLPMIIFANWRGFSGGQRDMFHEILKYGSYIVDALRRFEQPCFIYIVPNGELRGGAWVVLDPTINQNFMEMYADHDSRAGVLEPEGIVEIKFRRPQLITLMTKLDAEYAKLKSKMDDPIISDEEKLGIKEKLDAREQLLLPIYQQIAVAFADLHDTPGRMAAKRVIRSVVEWRHSRNYFYWRLRYLLKRNEFIRKIMNVNNDIDFNDSKLVLEKWIAELDGGHSEEIQGSSSNESLDDNKEAFDKLEVFSGQLDEKIKALKSKHMGNQIQRLLTESPDVVSRAIVEWASALSPEERNRLMRRISRIPQNY